MGFLQLEDPQISPITVIVSQIHSYTLRVSTFNVKIFKRVLFDFRISPYSFFNKLASLQLTFKPIGRVVKVPHSKKLVPGFSKVTRSSYKERVLKILITSVLK